eukprot:3932428-Pyramimonas_sp.AAC.1
MGVECPTEPRRSLHFVESIRAGPLEPRAVPMSAWRGWRKLEKITRTPPANYEARPEKPRTSPCKS